MKVKGTTLAALNESSAVKEEAAASFKASVHFCRLRHHYFREA
jgi:hypothetical protein